MARPAAWHAETSRRARERALECFTDARFESDFARAVDLIVRHKEGGAPDPPCGTTTTRI